MWRPSYNSILEGRGRMHRASCLESCPIPKGALPVSEICCHSEQDRQDTKDISWMYLGLPHVCACRCVNLVTNYFSLSLSLSLSLSHYLCHTHRVSLTHTHTDTQSFYTSMHTDSGVQSSQSGVIFFSVLTVFTAGWTYCDKDCHLFDY